jgi:hypothetical protein
VRTRGGRAVLPSSWIIVGRVARTGHGVSRSYSFRYLHRRFTEEGKLDAIPRQAKAVESVIGLSQKLRENSLRTEALDRQIENSAVAIGQRLNRLLVEPAVEVNGIKVSGIRRSVAAGVRRSRQRGSTRTRSA